MNWKFIFQLSLLGLIMALGTIALIPEKIEFLFWLVIFLICSYMIARVCTARHFLYGFMVSLFNSVYLTAAHTIFYNTYSAHHPDMQAILPFKDHIALSMIIVGIISGIVFGLIQGLFAFIASKLVNKDA